MTEKNEPAENPQPKNELAERPQPDITELMNRDPMELATEDLDQMIEIMREKLKNYQKDKAEGRKQPKHASEAPASIEDLGL